MILGVQSLKLVRWENSNLLSVNLFAKLQVMEKKKVVFHEHVKCQGKQILVLRRKNKVEEKQEWQLEAFIAILYELG